MRRQWSAAAWVAAGAAAGVGLVTLRPETVVKASGSAPAAVSVDNAAAVMEFSGAVFERAAREVAPAVVYVESRQPAGEGSRTEDSGSGVLIRPVPDAPPMVVTNLHVLGTARENGIDITLADGRMFHPRRILRDRDTDLALLEVPEELSDLPAARLADSRTVRVGQWTLVIGSPFGMTQSVSHGIISFTKRRQISLPNGSRIKEFLQTDAAINPGNSGGPLVNLRGEVIGISTAIASKSGNNCGVGFAIPSNLVRWVTTELAGAGAVRRGYLGVGFPKYYGTEEARRVGLEVARGAMVAVVHPESPAERAGLRKTDVVLEFDGTAIDDETHLINVVSQTTIGKRVPVVVWRDRRKVELAAVLGDWKEQEKAAD